MRFHSTVHLAACGHLKHTFVKITTKERPKLGAHLLYNQHNILED